MLCSVHCIISALSSIDNGLICTLTWGSMIVCLYACNCVCLALTDWYYVHVHVVPIYLLY